MAQEDIDAFVEQVSIWRPFAMFTDWPFFQLAKILQASDGHFGQDSSAGRSNYAFESQNYWRLHTIQYHVSQLLEELLQCIKIKLFLQPSGRLTPFLDLAICPCTSRLHTTFDRREPIGACSTIICLVPVLVFLFDSDESGLRKFLVSM